MRNLFVVLVATVLLAACGDGRQGIVISSDGTVADNSPERAKARAEDLLNRDLAAFKGTAAIASLPRWQDESRARAEGWYWQMVEVDVTTPTAASDQDRQEITELVQHRLGGAILGGDTALLVVISPTADAAAAPAEPAPAVEPVAAEDAPVAVEARPAAPAGRRYTVQEGDTLADISVAFFGTTQHWRAIAKANPGVDPATMAVGTILVIPAKP